MSSARLNWDAEVEAGRQAFRDDPHTSLRGKSGPFRQGFYDVSVQEMSGYTHLVSYETYSSMIGKWVAAQYRTTADAVPLHRKALELQKSSGVVRGISIKPL